MTHGWHLADLKSVPQNGLKVITTFSCGGGSSMGYKLAGYDVALANDIDPEMGWHYRTNLNPKHYVLAPIKELISKIPFDATDIDILDGSPPCSTFSTAGLREKAWGQDKVFREGQAKQVLSDLFFDFLDVVDELRPKVVIAENVKGMALGNAKGYCIQIFERLRKSGYAPQMFLLNASRCGVPQRRERVFVVAVRKDVSTKKLLLSPTEQPVSAEDATADLVLSQQERAALMFKTESDLRWWPRTNPGETYSDAVVRAGIKDKLWCHVKLDGRQPSCTLTASDTFKHWSECRALSFAEWKRLGSFPDDYMAKSDRIGKYMVGMSVPPKMMRTVADAVAKQWFGVS